MADKVAIFRIQWGNISKQHLHSILSHFFQKKKKTSKKCDNLGIFTQKVLFLNYNKTTKGKKVVDSSGKYHFFIL